MNRNRLPIVGFGALVFLNLGLMAFIWYDHLAGPAPRPPDARPGSRDFLARELAFSSDQASRAVALQKEQMRQGDSIRSELYRREIGLIEEMFRESPDTAAVRRIAEEIGRTQAEFDTRLFAHFNDIKEMCSPEQRDRLKRLLIDFAARSNGSADPNGAPFQPAPPNGPPQGDRKGPPPPRP